MSRKKGTTPITVPEGKTLCEVLTQQDAFLDSKRERGQLEAKGPKAADDVTDIRGGYAGQVNAKEYGGPTGILHAFEHKKLKLPLWVTIGGTSFYLTHLNYNGFWYGVMFATDEAWRKS